MDLNSIMFNSCNLRSHLDFFLRDPNDYIMFLTELFTDRNKVKNISTNNKAFMIVTLLTQQSGRDVFKALASNFELPEVLRACKIMDARRYIKTLECKLQKHDDRMHKKKQGDIRQKIMMAQMLLEDGIQLSLNSSHIHLIRQWIRCIDTYELDTKAALFPVDNWKELCDLTHPNASCFSVPWFLDYVHGKCQPPEDSLCYKLKNLTAENFKEFYSSTERRLPYKVIRMLITELQHGHGYGDLYDEIRALIVSQESIGNVLWYYNELVKSTSQEKILCERLEMDGIPPGTLGYGTIVDLLGKVTLPKFHSVLVEVATNMLEQYTHNISGKVAIFVDASSSMDVAIKTSSIVSSMLCALTGADMYVFRAGNEVVKNPPKTVTEAINFARTVKANGSTSPVSCMNYIKTKGIRYDKIIVVTDEEENTGINGGWKHPNYEGMFADIYTQYLKQVAPADLTFISFSRPNMDAIMVRTLKERMKDFYEKVSVFKYDLNNPDFNKLDYILASLGAKNQTSVSSMV